MNIQIVREKILDFLVARVRIDYWGLDYPIDLYAPTLSGTYPANSAMALPIQDVVHTSSGYGQIKTQARFPYRLAYRFPGELAYHELPFPALEGMLSFIHIVSLLQTPDPAIESFVPVKVEDSITVKNPEEVRSDWIVCLNFAFDARFNTTSIPDISDLQDPDYYNFDNPPSVQELKIRTYRAREQFKLEESRILPIIINNPDYILDSEIIIN